MGQTNQPVNPAAVLVAVTAVGSAVSIAPAGPNTGSNAHVILATAMARTRAMVCGDHSQHNVVSTTGRPRSAGL